MNRRGRKRHLWWGCRRTNPHETLSGRGHALHRRHKAEEVEGGCG